MINTDRNILMIVVHAVEDRIAKIEVVDMDVLVVVDTIAEEASMILEVVTEDVGPEAEVEIIETEVEAKVNQIGEEVVEMAVEVDVMLVITISNHQVGGLMMMEIAGEIIMILIADLGQQLEGETHLLMKEHLNI